MHPWLLFGSYILDYPTEILGVGEILALHRVLLGKTRCRYEHTITITPYSMRATGNWRQDAGAA
jgi:hypothetical protein